MKDRNIKIGMELEYDNEDGHYEIDIVTIIWRLGWKVETVSWTEHEGCVFEFEGGHQCHGKYIQGIVSRDCDYCGQLVEYDKNCDCNGSKEERRIDFEIDKQDSKRKGEY